MNTMPQNSEQHASVVEMRVMHRVYLMRQLERMLPNVMLLGVLLLISLYGIGREVWVARVFENAPHDAFLAPRFFIDALLGTRTLVQALVLAFGVSLIWLLRNVALAFVPFSPKQA